MLRRGSKSGLLPTDVFHNHAYADAEGLPVEKLVAHPRGVVTVAAAEAQVRRPLGHGSAKEVGAAPTRVELCLGSGPAGDAVERDRPVDQAVHVAAHVRGHISADHKGATAGLYVEVVYLRRLQERPRGEAPMC